MTSEPSADAAVESATDRQNWILAAVDRFERPLLQYVQRLLGERERARDVVQDTFLRLCDRGPRSHEDERTLAAWLFRTARNRALDVRKKESRMQPVGQDTALERPDPGRDPAQGLEHREKLAHLLRAVERLPDVQQEVVRLRFEHGLSYRQIAEVVERSVGTVGYLIHSALQALGRDVGAARGVER